jgi:hypothetical protein
VKDYHHPTENLFKMLSYKNELANKIEHFNFIKTFALRDNVMNSIVEGNFNKDILKQISINIEFLEEYFRIFKHLGITLQNGDYENIKRIMKNIRGYSSILAEPSKVDYFSLSLDKLNENNDFIESARKLSMLQIEKLDALDRYLILMYDKNDAEFKQQLNNYKKYHSGTSGFSELDFYNIIVEIRNSFYNGNKSEWDNAFPKIYKNIELRDTELDKLFNTKLKIMSDMDNLETVKQYFGTNIKTRLEDLLSCLKKGFCENYARKYENEFKALQAEGTQSLMSTKRSTPLRKMTIRTEKEASDGYRKAKAVLGKINKWLDEKHNKDKEAKEIILNLIKLIKFNYFSVLHQQHINSIVGDIKDEEEKYKKSVIEDLPVFQKLFVDFYGIIKKQLDSSDTEALVLKYNNGEQLLTDKIYNKVRQINKLKNLKTEKHTDIGTPDNFLTVEANIADDKSFLNKLTSLESKEQQVDSFINDWYRKIDKLQNYIVAYGDLNIKSVLTNLNKLGRIKLTSKFSHFFTLMLNSIQYNKSEDLNEEINYVKKLRRNLLDHNIKKVIQDDRETVLFDEKKIGPQSHGLKDQSGSKDLDLKFLARVSEDIQVEEETLTKKELTEFLSKYFGDEKIDIENYFSFYLEFCNYYLKGLEELEKLLKTKLGFTKKKIPLKDISYFKVNPVEPINELHKIDLRLFNNETEEPLIELTYNIHAEYFKKLRPVIMNLELTMGKALLCYNKDKIIEQELIYYDIFDLREQGKVVVNEKNNLIFSYLSSVVQLTPEFMDKFKLLKIN